MTPGCVLLAYRRVMASSGPDQARKGVSRRRYMFRRALVFLVLCLLIGGGVFLFRGGGPKSTAEPVAAASPQSNESETEIVEQDTDPPVVEITSEFDGLQPFDPVTVRGEVDEDATVSIAGEKKQVPAGEFSLTLRQPPRLPTKLTATDVAGNKMEEQLKFSVDWPPMRAVHVSGYAWASSSFRRTLLKMVDDRLINTIQLDLKDESGVISYDSKVPMARAIESPAKIYDLKDALRALHRRDVRVVGRIVCFRDPILAAASWPRHKERVIQTANGAPYANYGGFTNFADPVVRDYNIDIAEEAARAGIDDILYDYVRRPDGALSGFRFPGLKTSPESAIESFVGQTQKRLSPYGTKLGLSVYGIAATRPKEIAQPIGRLARRADYISPMVYPSHWAPGEYNVAHPNSQPYDIVYRSLKDFQKKLKGTRSRLIPWLQDFSLGVTYGPAEVRAQIDAAKDRGINEWILWDPKVTYTSAALTPMKPR